MWKQFWTVTKGRFELHFWHNGYYGSYSIVDLALGRYIAHHKQSCETKFELGLKALRGLKVLAG